MKLLREYIRVLLEQEQGSKGSLVVVDIQPEYESNTPFDIGDMLREAAENYSRVLFLYNGEDTLGMISESALKDFYFEKLDWDEETYDELLSKSTFFDKGYGFFRDVMDSSVCFDRSSIVEIVKYMIDKDIRDIQELEEEDVEAIGVSELLFDELEDYGFWVPDLEDELPKWNGADLVGGARNECMAEVEILGEAQGLGFNQVDEFIYEGEVRYATKTTTTLSEGVMVNGIQVDTEIASTPATRQQGLMFRRGMGEDSGMLFVFPDSNQRSFWMRNTPLPLSIAYTDDDGYILNIEDMEPFTEEHTYSNGPARCALEMNRGWFKRNGVRPGHRITGIPEIEG
tara:strand:+ start:210 stop:1235 length:1026 start_codon:yes stop_codon:yes gene_type:complete